tara:strand:+ start:702 stop:1043 length:342 start_codon:yes stop_codon:yes gene_type:complete
MAIKYRWLFDHVKVQEDTDLIKKMQFALDGIEFDDNGVAYSSVINGQIDLTTDVIYTGVTKQQCIDATLTVIGKTEDELKTLISNNVTSQITKSKEANKIIEKPNPFGEGIGS